MAVGGGNREIFGVIFDAENEAAVIRAASQVAESLKGIRSEGQKATRANQDLGRSFRQILVRTAAIVGVLRTFGLIRDSIDSLITKGFEYNSTIETAELSIASLITATADLVDAQGQVVDGAAGLDAAYALAVDQVQQLRIAGIQTAATTQELVDAFQQAVGAGIKTGLTLDEIRQVTIRIAQAAGALGVPYRQLNEEIRSILGGIIDQNTRIAKALGLRNEEVKLAKEQGRLAEFLLDKFEAFEVAGERIVTTWAAVRSNIAEAGELLAGQITQPLFDIVRTAGQRQLGRLFDFETAGISPQFEGLVTSLQFGFNQIGDLVEQAVTAILDGMESISARAAEMQDFFFSIGDSIQRIVVSVGKWWGLASQVTGELGFGQQILETMADTLEFIANNTAAWLTSVAVTLGLIGKIVAALIPAGATLFGLPLVPVLGAVAGLGVVVTTIDALTESEAERIQEQEKAAIAQANLNDQTARGARSALSLADQYRDQLDALNKTTEGTDEYAAALARLQRTERRIRAEGFTEILTAAGENRGQIPDALREEAQNLRVQLVRDIFEQRSQLDEIEAKIAERERILALRTPGARRKSAADRRREELARQLRRSIEAATADLDALNDAFNVTDLTLNVDDGADEAEAALKAFRERMALELARIKAELSEAENGLKLQLDLTGLVDEVPDLGGVERAALSYEEYFRRLAEARDEALAKQIALQEELIALETDQGKQNEARAKIEELQGQRRVQRMEEEAELLKQQVGLERQLDQVRKSLLEQSGQPVEAAILNVELQYEELIRRLRARGDQAGLDLVEQLIDATKFKAQFDEIEKTAQRAQNRLNQRLNQIQLQEQIGVLGQEDARRASAEVYRELEQELLANVAAMEALAAASTNPEIQRGAQDLRVELENVRLQIRALTDDWLRFRLEVRQILETQLGNFLANAVLEAESLSEAFKNLANVKSLLAEITAELIRLTTQMLAMKLVAKAFGSGFAEGGLVSPVERANGGLIPAFAGGGRVRGPGGPRDDRILARLSAGEYVVRAASVKKFGVDFMDSINRGLMPARIRGYRDGGMVQVAPGGGRSLEGSNGELRGELTVGLREGLVVDGMSGPSGSRLILKVIDSHRRQIRRSLGFS